MSKQDLICPSCGGFGFASKDVIVSAGGRLKCGKCGHWAEHELWLTVAQLRESVSALRLRAETAEKEASEAYAKGQRDKRDEAAMLFWDWAFEKPITARERRQLYDAIRTLPIKERP